MTLPMIVARLPPTRFLPLESLRQHELTDYRQKVGAAVETMVEVLINGERDRLSLTNRDIPGISALLSGGAPARVVHGRERLEAWMMIEPRTTPGRTRKATDWKQQWPGFSA